MTQIHTDKNPERPRPAAGRGKTSPFEFFRFQHLGFFPLLLAAIILFTFPPPATAQDDAPPDEQFTLKIGENKSWEPFPGHTTMFANPNKDAVAIVKTSDSAAKLTGNAGGESLVTAIGGGQMRTALVRVEGSAVITGAVAGYVNFIESELKTLPPEKQADYIIALGNYVALYQGASVASDGFTTMSEAATLLYPSTHMLNNHGSLLMRRGEYEDALVWLEKAVESAPENPVALTNLAECHYELGHHATALSIAERATRANPDHGLAYLLQTCVHLKNNNDKKAIETLFKSYRATWTTTTQRLSDSLLQRIREAARDADDPDDIMPLTPAHIKLLVESVNIASAGVTTTTAVNKLTFPFPVDPAQCLVADKSWDAAADAIRPEVDKMRHDYDNYWGGKIAGRGNKDIRQAYAMNFLAAYYEFHIKRTARWRALREKHDELEKEFYALYSSREKPVDETLKKAWKEIEIHQKIGLGSLITGNPAAAEKHTLEGVRLLQQYPITEAELKLALYTGIIPLWDEMLTQKARARRDAYEKEMRPFLEDYYENAAAILIHVENPLVRIGYESRAVWLINRHALIEPLSYTGYELSDVNKYRRQANNMRAKLKQAQDALVQQRDARIQANKTPNGKLKNFKEKETWTGDFTITLPVGPGVSVSFGMEGETLKAGYGAFGHEIIHGWNTSTGLKTETILTRASVLTKGVENILGGASGIRDALAAKSGKDYIKSLTNPIGNLPTIDRTAGEGKTYTYDRSGRLTDITTFKDDTLSAGWGPLGASQTTTTSRTRNQDFLSTQINTETKRSLSFGPFAIHE